MNSGIPTLADFQSARVTNPGQSEVIRQRLYDYQIYPAAGSQQLLFFQSQLGQGITSAVGAVAGTAKSKWDTNMRLSSQLPSGQAFLIESVEVFFQPGSVSTANTFTTDTLTFFLAAASAVPTAQLDDANIFYLSGCLELDILSKNYLQETPLAAFPPKTQIVPAGAISSNSATTAEVGFGSTTMQGRPYYMEPRIELAPAVNFAVSLTWPGLVAMTSGFNARVGVILDGYLMRASQ